MLSMTPVAPTLVAVPVKVELELNNELTSLANQGWVRTKPKPAVPIEKVPLIHVVNLYDGGEGNTGIPTVEQVKGLASIPA